jgi:hypothetical protein
VSISSSTPADCSVLTGLPLPDMFRMVMVRGAVFGVLALAWPAATVLALALL